MLKVQKQAHPFILNLSEYEGLGETDVSNLCLILQGAGVPCDCEDMELYPEKEPNAKTVQLITMFVLGVQSSEGVTIDFDEHKATFASAKRKKRSAAPTEEVVVETPDDVEEITGDDLTDDAEIVEEPAEDKPRRSSRRRSAS